MNILCLCICNFGAFWCRMALVSRVLKTVFRPPEVKTNKPANKDASGIIFAW